MGFTRTSVVYATPDLTLGTANAAGSVASAIRSDSTVLVYDTTVPEDVTSGSSTAGDSATAARRNHVHGIGSAAGDVSGGASSIDNGVVRFDGTGGKTIQGGYAMAVAIADTGYLGLGKAAPVSLLDLDQTTTGEGCATFKRSSNVDTTFRDMINFNHTSQVGQILCSNSATQYNTSSDYRLKENVVPITDALERLNELKPSRFNFIISPILLFLYLHS